MKFIRKKKRIEKDNFVEHDVFSIDTGKFTGRSPKDKYIVLSDENKDKIWWGK